MRIITASADETFKMGMQLGQSLRIPCTIAFRGELGAGKTTFIRGLAFSLGAEAREVCSPTFTYLNIYQGQIPIYHFDLYRMPHALAFENAGFEEYLSAYGVCCIEWSDAIAPLLENKTDFSLIKVSIEHRGEDLREICIQ